MTSDLLDPRMLQLFDLLYDTRSVTRTAERLGQSQPTVSIWLGRLRRALGDPLFIRTPSGMAPTPQADAMIGQCREILESLRRFASWELVFEPARAKRRFRVCMTDAGHITLLPTLLAHVRMQAPGVRLEVIRIDGNTEHALESGEVDLAIGYLPWLGDGIYQQLLYEQDWVCLASRSHPRINSCMDLDQYCAEGHVSIAEGTGTSLLKRSLVREGIERKVVLDVPWSIGLGAIIHTTDLLVTLPRNIGVALGALYDLAVYSSPITVEHIAVRQHWHFRYHNEAGSRWLRSVVVKLFSNSLQQDEDPTPKKREAH